MRVVVVPAAGEEIAVEDAAGSAGIAVVEMDAAACAVEAVDCI
jgi:hypothetical protein